MRLNLPVWVFLASLILVAHPQDSGAQGPLQVGYGLMTAASSSPSPSGAAIFSFVNSSGILVSQAGVGAAEPLRSGRIFVDETSAQTGVATALHNKSDGVLVVMQNGYASATGQQWLPSSGRSAPGALVLPTVTLGWYSTAVISRMTRSTVSFKDDFNLSSITGATSATITGILVGDVNNSWVIPT